MFTQSQRTKLMLGALLLITVAPMAANATFTPRVLNTPAELSAFQSEMFWSNASWAVKNGFKWGVCAPLALTVTAVGIAGTAWLGWQGAKKGWNILGRIKKAISVELSQ